MDPFHFACPHCSSRLRVREKLYVGRQVDCPECGRPLLIVEEKGELAVRPVERKVSPAVPAAPNAKSLPPASDAPAGPVPADPVPAGPVPAGPVPAGPVPAGPVAAGPVAAKPLPGSSNSGAPGAGKDANISLSEGGIQTAVPSRRRTSILIAGVLVLALVVIGAAFFAKSSGTSSDAGLSNETVAGQTVAPGENLAGDSPVGAANPAQPQPSRDDVDSRLTKLGRRLLDHVAADQAFPSGTVPILGIAPENRMSWMAVLADRAGDSAVPPIWDKSWKSPQNEAFVRRRLAMFQNPAIAELTGTDGYPASHFVGVTGVGADAARLDNRHPRAGIFGEDRRTRLDDIRDGTSNTLLVLGVRDHLGSWAAGGQPTLRGLVREPYVNGPDGFGTGSPDSMQALLADGRVLVISEKIDPRILRRMAAKADGLPLDESAEGEPGDRPPLLAGEPNTLDDDEEMAGSESPADKRPLDPEFAAEPPLSVVKKIDLAVSLKQPIVRFDQPKSRPLSDVLTGVAEMAGAQIDFDRDKLGPAAARLAEPVALKLDNTTVGDILTGLLRPAGLAYRVEGDHLKVVVRGEE